MIERYVKCPITNFHTITEILLFLKNQHPTKIKKISEFLEISTTSINNALPIMRELGLIITKSRGIDLTDNGIVLVDYLIKDDKKGIKEFAKNKLILKSKILTEAYKILYSAPKTSSENLGILLNNRLDTKKWLHDATYRNVGRTCKYILDGLQFVEYKDIKHRKGGGRHRSRLVDKLLPYITTEKMFELVDKFEADNTWKVTDHNNTDTQNMRMVSFANSLIDLGIAEYINHNDNIILLTNSGKELKSAKDEDNRKEVFQTILLEYPPIQNILGSIIEKYNRVGYKDIGDLLEKYNNVNWAKSTKKAYSVKLLNWLKEAKILTDNGEWGKYCITQPFLEKYRKSYHNVTTYDEMQKGIKLLTQKIESKDTQEKTTTILDTDGIFKNLITNLTRLLYSKNDNWHTNNIVHNDIIDDLNQLINDSNGLSNAVFSTVKHLVEKGYETKDGEDIEHCLELIVNLDSNNKLIT